MTGDTHRVGGVLCAVAGYSILEANGMLLNDVNPLLQLAIMYPFAIYGSIMPDLDHNWNSVPSKDLVSLCINKVLHLSSWIRTKYNRSAFILKIFDARHRSWQTHSLLFLLLLVALSVVTINYLETSINAVIFKLISTGLILGVISHLVLDALTPGGIWLAIPSLISGKKMKLRFVPKSSFFSTGNAWERCIRIFMWVAIVILLLRVFYLASPYRFEFNF